MGPEKSSRPAKRGDIQSCSEIWIVIWLLGLRGMQTRLPFGYPKVLAEQVPQTSKNFCWIIALLLLQVALFTL